MAPRSARAKEGAIPVAWDEESFFEHARRLAPETLRALQDLYTFSRKHASSVDWGTGRNSGSFNPKFEVISEKSVFTAYNNGTLQLNFGWLSQTDAGRTFVPIFAARLRDAGFSLPDDFEQRYVILTPEDWVPLRAGFERALADSLRVTLSASGHADLQQ